LPGMPDQHYTGKIANLGQELDETTRVMEVRIVLNNSSGHLKPEMLANADIPVGARKPQLLVPPTHCSKSIIKTLSLCEQLGTGSRYVPSRLVKPSTAALRSGTASNPASRSS